VQCSSRVSAFGVNQAATRRQAAGAPSQQAWHHAARCLRHRTPRTNSTGGSPRPPRQGHIEEAALRGNEPWLFNRLCQSVRRPAAIRAAVAALGFVGGGGRTVSAQAARAASRFGGQVRVVFGTRKAFSQRTAVLPNPSLKRSANGRPPGPGRRCTAHCLRPGPGGLPLAPA
jgi:hypothetical protein